MSEKQLRFAVICNNFEMNDWDLDVINRMEEQENVLFSAVINIPGKHPVFKKNHSVTDLFHKRITWMNCEASFVQGNYSFGDEDINKIEEMKLDVILNLSSTKVEGEILTIPEFGVWSFKFGNSEPPFYWEVVNEEHITSASLRKIAPENRFITLKQGHFSTLKYSFSQNRSHVMKASTNWPALVCRDILNGNAEYFADDPRDEVKETEQKMMKSVLFLKMLKHKLRKVYTKLFCYEYWNVGVINRPIESFLTSEGNMEIQWLSENKHMYIADPFIYKNGEELKIIMEELNHKVVKGFISEAAILQHGNKHEFRFSQATISSPAHMSYPYILEHDGEVYCIPETSEAGEVSVYKLNQDSKEWYKVKSIINNFPAVDSTIIQYGDYWWLFCTKANSTIHIHNYELYLFYSTNLMGEWKHHQMNPVKMDIQSSRPAGTPFIHEGHLYRPAQDCSITYGGRVALNRINELTPSKFDEETVMFVEPNLESLYPDGLHTITSAGEMTIIDSKRFDYHPLHILRKLYKFKPVNLERMGIESKASSSKNLIIGE
jgi:hypothetical protein